MPSSDDISIAFKNSNYPTPYGDNSIPGNKPHHPAPSRLGRDYADYRCQLNNALVAPGREGVSAEEEVAAAAAVAAANGEARRRAETAANGGNSNNKRSVSGTKPGNSAGAAQQEDGGDSRVCRGGGDPRPCLRAAENYVLNVKNGGRRHFAEERGRQSEWRPSVRQLDGCWDEQRSKPHPHRRGQGMFNMDDKSSLHPAAHAALERREQDKQRQEAGKAMVVCPPNHTAAELGLWVPEHFSPSDSREKGKPSEALADAPDILVVEHGVSAEKKSTSEAEPSTITQQCAANSGGGSAHLWGSPGSVSAVDTLSPTPRQREAFDVAASRQATNAARSTLRATRRAQGERSTRREDVEAVHRLPDI